MNRFLLIAAFTVSTSTLCAATIDIPKGGYSIEADSTAKPSFTKDYETRPANVIFPRVLAKNFYLDSVIWTSANPKENLDAVLSNHPKDPKFIVTGVRPFITSSGIKSLRFELQNKQATKRNLHRLIFRNSKGQVICVGIFGESDVADQVFSSIALLK